MTRWRALTAVVFLLAQVTWILSGRRPALWAPFHEHAVYSLHVTVDGRTLDTLQSLERYHLPKWHASAARDEAWETNSLQFVKDAIAAQEKEQVRVELRARVNGDAQPTWEFLPLPSGEGRGEGTSP
jgi:hypothetical protein